MANHPREPKPKSRRALEDRTLKAPESATTPRTCQAPDEVSSEAENTPRAEAVLGAISDGELEAEVDRFLESLR